MPTYYEEDPFGFGETWETGGVLDLVNTIHVTADSTLDLNGYTLSAKKCEDTDAQSKTILVIESGAEFRLSGGKLESCRNRTMDEVIGGGASTTGATTIYTAESSKFTISGSARIGPGTATATNIKDLLIAGKLYANGGVVEGTVQCGSGIAAAGSSITEFTSSVYVDGGILNGIFDSDVTVNGDISTST